MVDSCCSVVAKIKYAARVLLSRFYGTLSVSVCCYADVRVFWVAARVLGNVGRGLKCFWGEFLVVARLNF